MKREDIIPTLLAAVLCAQDEHLKKRAYEAIDEVRNLLELGDKIATHPSVDWGPHILDPLVFREGAEFTMVPNWPELVRSIVDVLAEIRDRLPIPGKFCAIFPPGRKDEDDD